MSTILTFLTAFLLIVLGINLAANNILHRIIVDYIFTDDKISKIITRLLGLLLIISSLLLLFNFLYIFLLVNIAIIIIFLFFVIRSKSKNTSLYNKRKEELISKRKLELQQKRRNIEQLKKELNKPPVKKKK